MNRHVIPAFVLLTAACTSAPATPLTGHYALFVDTAYSSVPAEYADIVATAIHDRIGSVETVADPAAAESYDAVIIVHLPTTFGGEGRSSLGRGTNVDASGAPENQYVAGSSADAYMTYEIVRAGRTVGEGGVRVTLPRGTTDQHLGFNASATSAAHTLANDIARKLPR